MLLTLTFSIFSDRSHLTDKLLKLAVRCGYLEPVDCREIKPEAQVFKRHQIPILLSL